jgi:cyclic beta-1,2-glucan synthetase
LLASDTVRWTEWQTDRDQFIGRGRSLRQPVGRTRPLPADDTPMTATLDTCVVMSGLVEVGPGRACECAFVTIFGSSREQVLERAHKFASIASSRRALIDAERHGRERAHVRGHDTAILRLHQRLLSMLLYPRPQRVTAREELHGTGLGQPSLWRHGISGDWPILLLRVNEESAATVARLADAHSSWHERGIIVDLVVLEERPASYDGALRQRLAQMLELVGARLSAPQGGVFLIAGSNLAPAERALLLRRANLIISNEADLARVLNPPEDVPPPPRFNRRGNLDHRTRSWHDLVICCSITAGVDSPPMVVNT